MERLRGTAEMTAAMMISGTIGWFVLVSGQAVIDVVFWRCLFGAGTLALVCLALGLFRRDVITLRQAGFAALGGVAIVLNWLLLFAAYPRASISIATAVYNTQPFMLVGFGVVFFAEKLTVSKLFWLGLAFVGMLGIVQAKGLGVSGPDYLAGIAMALGAAFFYALAAIVAKRLKGVPPHLIALIQVVVGMAMLAPLAHLSTLPHEAGTWAILGTLGVVHTGLMYILLYGAIQKLPTSLTGALSFIYPVVAVAVDLIAFGHRLEPLQIAGAAAILVAAAGMTLGWTPLRGKSAPRGMSAAVEGRKA
ncbi:multidrug DMT transporter permease [Labrys miyagiensis]|uniref:Multidrug DMT transporter permease n=1 Tax=Labrys miyagiensis TaxID=346912 RepID=A0ABQ6CQJ6_9HYPH|nr:DMT family transporter [Labrys miyagiensis]GLS22633.1 multidrug DMT transporter permease [Labrys miyagiensis]